MKVLCYVEKDVYNSEKEIESEWFEINLLGKFTVFLESHICAN